MHFVGWCEQESLQSNLFPHHFDISEFNLSFNGGWFFQLFSCVPYVYNINFVLNMVHLISRLNNWNSRLCVNSAIYGNNPFY